MSVENRRQELGKADLVLGWSAVATASAAVFAWTACCVLPIALSVAGLSLAGTAWIAGQRSWLTIATVLVLGAGWWTVWRRRRACDADSNCRPPSPMTLGLLSAATLLALAALVWRPLIEPWLLSLLRAVRG
ncbi:MFS transporter permease [Phenylobacterium sp.]|uniref:MFS transporter permease n=1 Tax=Phenylobacterium sp. TaxID=1871053 RepID=UPI003BAC610F